MDKDWRIKKRKIGCVGMALFLALNLLTNETVYASAQMHSTVTAEMPSTVSGPAIKVTTENSDSNKSYDIRVEWGDMQFVYDFAAPKWDTEALEYVEVGEEGWKESGFNGSNNKIQIENRSNAEITVDLMIELNYGAFNEMNTENGVQAHFYDTNEHAIQASKILTDLDEASYEGRITELVLESAEAVVDVGGTIVKPAGVRTVAAYFAFSGKPDKTLNTATEVGGISLVFTDTSD